jgi:hypothetical protein
MEKGRKAEDPAGAEAKSKAVEVVAEAVVLEQGRAAIAFVQVAEKESRTS